MYFSLGVCVLVLVLDQNGSFAASRVDFTASPLAISPGFTQTLTIRCSVLQDPVSVSHVGSIVVIRNNKITRLNETVAVVTAFDPPSAQTDIGKLHVTGSVNSPNPGEDGYLDLKWTNPTTHQYGTYLCEVFMFSPQTSNIIVESLLIGLNEPSIPELLLYISDLENRTTALENRVSQVQSGNVETGDIVCIQGTNDYPITFSVPYSAVPKVITAVHSTSGADAYVGSSSAVSLTLTGFTLRCTSVGTSNIVWVAI